METPSTPQQTPDGGGRSPSAAPPPLVLSSMRGPGYSRGCPSIGSCRWHRHGTDLDEILAAYEEHWADNHAETTALLEREHLAAQRDRDIEAGVDPVEAIAEYEEATRSPRAGGDPAVCDPGRHVSGPWCSRCGQWFVDGEWRNTPPETTRSPRAPESAFGCLCATDPDGCPIHRHYPAEVHSDDVMLSAVAEEIRVVLNRYSAEAPSGTPDYILANYLIDCLKAFNEAVSLRAVWRGEPIEQMVLHIDKER